MSPPSGPRSGTHLGVTPPPHLPPATYDSALSYARRAMALSCRCITVVQVTYSIVRAVDLTLNQSFDSMKLEAGDKRDDAVLDDMREELRKLLSKSLNMLMREQSNYPSMMTLAHTVFASRFMFDNARSVCKTMRARPSPQFRQSRASNPHPREGVGLSCVH